MQAPYVQRHGGGWSSDTRASREPPAVRHIEGLGHLPPRGRAGEEAVIDPEDASTGDSEADSSSIGRLSR